MSILNYDDLHSKISENIEEYRELLKGGNPENIQEAFENMLNERALIIDEINEMRERRQYVSYTIPSGMHLIVDDLEISTANDLQLLSRKINRPVGDIINALMGIAVEKGVTEITAEDLRGLVRKRPLSEARLSISHQEELEICREDLEDLEWKVNFNHISDLYFADDISMELFSEKVGSINHCGHISVPGRFSKLVMLSKGNYCHAFEFRE